MSGDPTVWVTTEAEIAEVVDDLINIYDSICDLPPTKVDLGGYDRRRGATRWRRYQECLIRAMEAMADARKELDTLRDEIAKDAP